MYSQGNYSQSTYPQGNYPSNQSYQPQVIEPPTLSTPMIGLTADDLLQKSDLRIVHDIVQQQIKLIDAQIINNHTMGFDQIAYDLPVNFQINAMNKSDAQTLIYSELLMIYSGPPPKGKGFPYVAIDLGEKSTMHIKWRNGMNSDERRSRQAYIQSHKLQPKKVTNDRRAFK